MSRRTPDRWAGSDFEVDLEKPSPARMYDYYLGGYHNFAIDRKVAQQVLDVAPQVQSVAISNRAFLRRAVTVLVEAGVDQFLDIGSGIPTAGNVHEVAQGLNPDARVVYVDVDPVAIAHSQAILEGASDVTALQGDVRRPERILSHPGVTELLDFSRPVALLLVAILHFVPDDDRMYAAVRRLRAALASGSFMAVSHATFENVPAETVESLKALYRRSTRAAKPRSYEGIRKLFAGLEMVDPGLVWLPAWRPESSDDHFLDRPEQSMTYAGVGRKP